MNIVRCRIRPPKGGSKMQCPKFEQLAAITPKRYEIGCQLLLITDRKSHTDFPLVLTLALILRFSPKSTDFQADYITLVENRPIVSVKYCPPVPVFHI